MRMYNSLFLYSSGTNSLQLPSIFHCLLLQHASHIDIPNYIFRPKYTGKYDIRNMVVVWFCLMVVTMNWCMQSTTSTTSSSRSAWSSAMTTVADRLLFSGPFFISLLLNWLLFLRIYLLRCFRPRCTFIFWFGCSWFAWRII